MKNQRMSESDFIESKIQTTARTMIEDLHSARAACDRDRSTIAIDHIDAAMTKAQRLHIRILEEELIRRESYILINAIISLLDNLKTYLDAPNYKSFDRKKATAELLGKNLKSISFLQNMMLREYNSLSEDGD